MEAQAAAHRALASVVEQSLKQIEAQDKEILTAILSNREAVLTEQRSLCDAVRLQTAAIDARTGLLRELGQGALAWFQNRWITLILGLAVGLGLAGAGEVLGAVIAQLGKVPG